MVVKPLLFKEANPRGQADLIDIQTNADGEFKYILNDQDHLTKFCMLKPSQSKRADEVAYNLLDIFCTIVVLSVLQSDNGMNFFFK